MSVTPKTFEFEGQKYKTVMRGRKFIVAMRSLGSCCEDWRIFCSNDAVLQTKGNKTKVKPNIIWNATELMVADELSGEGDDTFKTKALDMPAFEPKTIPGTSEGVKYKVLFVTNKGYVSYKPSSTLEGQVRIRVAKKDSSESWPDYGLGNGSNWESVNSTHLAQNSHNVEEAKLLIARGVDALFKLEA